MTQKRDWPTLSPVITISLSNVGPPDATLSVVVYLSFGIPTRYSCPKVSLESIQAFRCNFQFTENIGDPGRR